MAYKCLFMDNDIYTAQDVNDAISNIIANGVSGYPFGGNALEDLNEAIEELVNDGVDYRGTSCLVVNDNGTYKISEGVCIMKDGSQIVFDANGYALTIQSGVLQYVYLERDVLNNGINIVVSQEAGGEDTVPLAEIDATGNITDRRHFATAKISLSAEPGNISVTQRITTAQLNENNRVNFGFSGWKYLICRRGDDFKTFKFDDGQSVSGLPNSNTTSDIGFGLTAVRQGSELVFTRIHHSTDVEYEVR